ncbi:MAG: hypothetical protein KOO61_04725 [Spirochaetales bacterium]|nr:hypothetical protein [Spirochaetales bacterium]
MWYASLKNQKASTNGWVTAQCPFHDDNNPSFAFEMTTGNWKCHRGCGEGTVIDYEAKVRDLSFKETLLALGDELGVPRPEGYLVTVTRYDYRDAGGDVLYQVVKSPGKIFWQQRPDGKGGWIKNLKGVPRVLYNLPGLIARPDDRVFIVEGEKDADRLASIGLLATTSPGGAGKWTAAYAETLLGRDVVILPDNDIQGRTHAQDVAKSLSGKATSVRTVQLPGLPEKGDISDWLDNGGDGEKLEALVDETEPIVNEAQLSTGDPLPVIEIHDRPLREIFDDAWAAVLASNNPPKVFNSAGRLARLRDFGYGPQIEFLNKEGAYCLLARVADWIRTKGNNTQHTKPLKETADELIVNPHPDLPVLEAVITTPVFDHDWRLIFRPGYDRESKLWLHLAAKMTPFAIPKKPTTQEVDDARSLILDDLLVDFPFTADSDRAHAFAAILLPFARRMFTGPTPIHLIEASTPGAGKSLLAEQISTIAMGASHGCTTLTSNEEESRKKLTALFSQGAPVVFIDNLQGGLWSAQVAAAITAEVWEDRILGKSQMVTFANRALWLVSGNNPKLSMEIARRCIRIRIDPKEEKPWQRKGFKHDPIREWVQDNRHEIVQAVLTLIQHWIVSRSPYSTQTLGSFENWARMIGGIVSHSGLPDFLADTDEFYEAADPEAGEMNVFIHVWWERFNETPKAPSVLLDIAQTEGLIPFAYVGNTEQARLAKFGKTLSTIRDRKFGQYSVMVTKNKKRGSNDYRLVGPPRDLFNSKEQD